MNKCKVISVALEKGGTSKSSTVQNVGVVLSQLDYRVLCVDNDAQGHLSITFLKDTAPELLPLTLTDLIEKVVKQELLTKEMVDSAIIKTNTVDLLPSTYLMNRLDTSMNSISSREYILTDILELVKDDYDFILIDNNSSSNIFTVNSLAFSDYAILPCQTQYLSMGAIALMLSSIKTIKRRVNPTLQLGGILLTMYQANTKQSKQTVEMIREEYGDSVFKTIIPMSTKVPDAQKMGMSVVEYDKNNAVSIAYKEFVAEFVKEILNDE